jgi:Clp protease
MRCKLNASDKVQIYTVNIGTAYGQACMLLASGQHGKRFSLEHSTAQLQQPRVPPTGARQAIEVQVRILCAPVAARFAFWWWRAAAAAARAAVQCVVGDRSAGAFSTHAHGCKYLYVHAKVQLQPRRAPPRGVRQAHESAGAHSVRCLSWWSSFSCHTCLGWPACVGRQGALAHS